MVLITTLVQHANFPSLRCVQLIAGVLGRAGEIGQRKRLEAAKRGDVTWLPPPGLGKPFEDDEAKMKELEEEEKKLRGSKPRRDSGRRTFGRTEREDVDDL